MQAAAISTERTVKGSHISVAIDLIDQQLGAGATAAMAAAHGMDWSVVLPVAQYEVDVLLLVLDEVAGKLHTNVQDLTTAIARENASRDLRSIYRLFMRVAQPTRVLQQTPRLWRTYVAFGDARALLNEPGQYVGEGSNLEGRDMDWACGCWLGFIPFAVEMAGGRDVRGRILSRERQPSGLYTLKLEVRYS